MVNYCKSCPENVMHLRWLDPPSINYNQNPLTDIYIKHCQGVKIQKTTDFDSNSRYNLHKYKNNKKLERILWWIGTIQKYKIYKRRIETKELCVWQCFWSIK